MAAHTQSEHSEHCSKFYAHVSSFQKCQHRCKNRRSGFEAERLWDLVGSTFLRIEFGTGPIASPSMDPTGSSSVVSHDICQGIEQIYVVDPRMLVLIGYVFS